MQIINQVCNCLFRLQRYYFLLKCTITICYEIAQYEDLQQAVAWFDKM